MINIRRFPETADLLHRLAELAFHEISRTSGLRTLTPLEKRAFKKMHPGAIAVIGPYEIHYRRGGPGRFTTLCDE